MEKEIFDYHFASLMLTGLFDIYISPWANWEFSFHLRNTELLFRQDTPAWQPGRMLSDWHMPILISQHQALLVAELFKYYRVEQNLFHLQFQIY